MDIPAKFPPLPRHEPEMFSDIGPENREVRVILSVD
jgi:hypothetical protein